MALSTAKSPVLNNKTAEHLYRFAFDCIEREYPNKLGQVLADSSDLKTPKTLHPSFYGCFDWHSSVHGHWALLNIVKALPDFEKNGEIMLKIKRNITKTNIEQEVAYFGSKYNKDFERTYGWAWLLKVAETLRDWNTEESIKMYADLEPLVKLIENKYIDFLSKLNYPIRVGEHPNTAFGLSFALDYAKKYSPELEKMITEKSKTYYMNDENCPLTWEPGGFDFLSPCLQEATLMQKVLSEGDFKIWLSKFLPGFKENPEKFLTIAEVSDRSDGKMAHLDGLNFSRAWCLYELGYGLQNQKMIDLANRHFEYSYSLMDNDEYMGSHWLASFALYAILKTETKQ